MNKIKSIISDEFNITLTVTNSCNYRCKYCPPNLQNGSEEPILVETYINFFTNLIKDNPQINDYSERFISITGGEPSLYKGIEELISFLNENNFNVTLDSNGSAPKEVWERLFEKTNNTHLSFHPRYSKFPKFDELIEIGQRKNAMMSIGLLMDPEHWDRVLEAVEHFKQYNIPVSYKGVVARTKSENSVKKEIIYLLGNIQVCIPRNNSNILKRIYIKVLIEDLTGMTLIMFPILLKFTTKMEKLRTSNNKN